MLSQLARAALLASLLLLAFAAAAGLLSSDAGLALPSVAVAREAVPAGASAEAEHILWNAGCWLFGLGLVMALGRPRELVRGERRSAVAPARPRLVQRQNVA